MSEVCDSNEPGRCEQPVQTAAPLVSDSQPSIPIHTARAPHAGDQQAANVSEGKPHYETGLPSFNGFNQENSEIAGTVQDNKVSIRKNLDASPLHGTEQAEKLLQQAWDSVIHNHALLNSPDYRNLLRKAMTSADQQFNADKNRLHKQIDQDQLSLQHLDKTKLDVFRSKLSTWVTTPSNQQKEWRQIEVEKSNLHEKLANADLASNKRDALTDQLSELSHKQYALLPPQLRQQLVQLGPDVVKEQQLQTEIQQLHNQLEKERLASVMSRVYLAQALKSQHKDAEANQLIRQAMFSIGGTPMDIVREAKNIQIRLMANGTKPEEAFGETRPVWLLAQDVSDVASKYALDELYSYGANPNVRLSQPEKNHLITTAMSAVESRLVYAVADYNSVPTDKHNAYVSKTFLQEAQSKLSNLSELLQPLAPTVPGDISAWANPLAYVAQDFVKPIQQSQALISGALNQIDNASTDITYDSALATASELSPVQQMACDTAAMLTGFSAGVGAAALDTTETLGTATIPTFLLTRSAIGSLTYNSCRILYGKVPTPGSVAWGATDGLLGGIDKYALETISSKGLINSFKAILPGSLAYSYAGASTDYYTGRVNSPIGFGADYLLNLKFSMGMGLGLTYPTWTALGLGLAGDKPSSKPSQPIDNKQK